jgi:hypothetical protein
MTAIARPMFAGMIMAGLAVGAAAPAVAADALAVPAAAPVPQAYLFGLIGPDYKKPREVPDVFFNPFKIQASSAIAAGPKKDAVSNEAIAEAIARRGVTGIVCAPDGHASRVIIGDQVFAAGDELSFPVGEKDGLAPLVPGASTVLREVGPESLSFEVTPDGEAARRLNFPLRDFWRP